MLVSQTPGSYKLRGSLFFLPASSPGGAESFGRTVAVLCGCSPWLSSRVQRDSVPHGIHSPHFCGYRYTKVLSFGVWSIPLKTFVLIPGLILVL